MEKGRTDKASITISVSPYQVYNAFSKSDSVLKWLPPSGMSAEMQKYEFKIGGVIHMTLFYLDPDENGMGKTSKNMDVVKGRFTEIIANQCIVQVFEFDSKNPEFAGEMKMTWTFSPVSNGTNVQIVAENVPHGIRKEDHEVGLNSTLHKLSSFLKGK